MPKKKSYITLTDMFCGAGGSSQGAKKALDRVGGEIKLAMNHWKLAIETHNTNFPDTLHDCTDISASDPRRYPSTDGAVMSPECTTHTPAGGNNHKTLKKQMDMFDSGKIDPATERSRATMWDVCRYAEYHNYNFIVVENVVEAKTRWPLFDNWLTCMHTLGYNHKCVYHNSMHHHPTPQSRDRMYVVFWKKGNKAPNLDFTPAAHCGRCEKNVQSVQTWKKADVHYGKYKQQYVYCCPTCTSVVDPYYYAAFNCIDWSDIGTRIGDRKKPLKPKTMERIAFGRKKYAGHPFQVQIAYSTTRGITRKVTDPCYSQATTVSSAIIQNPFIIQTVNGENDEYRSKSMDKPLFAQTTFQSMGIAQSPLLVNNYSPGYTKPVTDTTGAITCADHHGLLCPPFIIKGEHGLAEPMTRRIDEATQTQVTRQTMSLVTTESWNSFIAQYYSGSHCVSHITEEIGTVTVNDRSGLISYKEPALEDFYYRMLKPTEIKLAMAFNHDYIILGSGKDQVKQLGNAVTPPVMEWLVQQCIESLN